jgi:hypothetical protein
MKDVSSESNPILFGSEKLSCFIFTAFAMSSPSLRSIALSRGYISWILSLNQHCRNEGI